MKKLIPIFSLLLLFTCIGSHAQQCDDFLYFQEGKTFTSNNYDKKGKVETISTATVAKVSSTGKSSEAVISVNVTDPKGNHLLDMAYVVSCDGKGLYFDMTTMMNQETMAGFGELQMTTDKNLLRMPPNMAVGDELPNGRVELTLAEGAMSVSVSVIERQVLGREEITIDGKSYDCFKISYVNLTEMGFIKIKINVLEWWNEDLLMVKSENYNKKGKLMSSTTMESFQ